MLVSIGRIGLALLILGATYSYGGAAGKALQVPSCSAPHLHPSTLIIGLPSSTPVQSGIGSVALDARGNAVWSIQAEPPYAGRLYLYDARAGRVAPVASPSLAGGLGIGALGLSPRWVTFALIGDRQGGGDWRIVARDRRSGAERVVTSSPLGSVGSAPYSFDGGTDTLVWVQPHAPEGGMLRAEDLDTGQARTLATATNGSTGGSAPAGATSPGSGCGATRRMGRGRCGATCCWRASPAVRPRC